VASESSAEVIRSAAAMMRERARAATPGRWQAGVNPRGVFIEQTSGHHLVAEVGWCPSHRLQQIPEAEHIASWHPLVALAVADWLDNAALESDALEAAGCSPLMDAGVYRATAVARAYLGEAATAAGEDGDR
jgi:hypothetical protein